MDLTELCRDYWTRYLNGLVYSLFDVFLIVCPSDRGAVSVPASGADFQPGPALVEGRFGVSRLVYPGTPGGQEARFRKGLSLSLSVRPSVSSD